MNKSIMIKGRPICYGCDKRDCAGGCKKALIKRAHAKARNYNKALIRQELDDDMNEAV